MNSTFGIMRNALVTTALITFAVFATKAQTPVVQQNSLEEILERFCKMDAEGKQLAPEGRSEMAVLLFGQKPPAENREITVVKDYVVRAPEIRGDTAQIAVDYNVWGRLDSSLHFSRLGGPLLNYPIQVTEYITMIRSDKHLELGSDGRWQEVKGVPEWRIRSAPSAPHVSVEAAIRYVQELRSRSKDPIIKENADSAIASLTALLPLSFRASARPIQQSPVDVVSQFVAMETNGSGLTAIGQKQLDAFLVQPTSWRGDKIHVANDFAVSNSVYSGSKAELYVEYIAMGELDSSLRFTSAVPGGSKVREGYKLTLDNKYAVPNGSGKEMIGPGRWKIEDSPSEQWIAVNVAIRYVTELRDKTTDPAIRKNGDQTIAKLNTLH